MQLNNCLLIWSLPFSSEIGNSVWMNLYEFPSCTYHVQLMWNVKPDWESRSYTFPGPMEHSNTSV